MKIKTLIIPILALSAIVFTSCDSKAKLASNLEGTWRHNATDIEMNAPLKVYDNEIYTIRAINNYEFMPAVNNQGELTATALITIDIALKQNSDSIVQPLYESLAATASIKGNYVVDSHESVAISYDDSTFELQVDPAGRLDEINYLTQQNEVLGSTVGDFYRQAIESAISTKVRQQLTSVFQLRDIEFSDGRMQMEAEVGHQDIYLSKVITVN